MAKKSKRERLVGSVESYILYIYDTGIVQSTIIHTILLICMALITLIEPPDKKISLVLSFTNETTDVLQEPVVDLSIDQSEINKDIDDQASKWSQETISEHTEPEIASVTYEESPVEEPALEVPDFSISDLNTVVQDDDEPFADTIIEPVPKPEVVSKPKAQRYTSRSKPTTQNKNNRRNVFGDFDSFGGGGGQNIGMNQNGNGVGNNQYGDINRRLVVAGAKTGDIQISIAWNTIDDIDLHVLTYTKTSNAHISWMNRVSMEGGCLDVDQNASPTNLTPTPVENVFWPKGFSPDAEYVVAVHHFRNWSGKKNVPVTIIVKVFDKTKVFHVNAPAFGPVVEVTSFTKQSFR